MKSTFPNTITKLESMLARQAKIHRFSIDCKQLLKNKSCSWEERHKKSFSSYKLLKRLDKITNPCIYWFDAPSSAIAQKLITSLDDFRASQKDALNSEERVVPASNSNKLGNVIYVGKRYGGFTKKTGVSHICGRIFIHLGYYKVGSTQGLQLNRWAYRTDATIRLNILELPSEATEFLDVFEKLVAMEFKPLCGKH